MFIIALMDYDSFSKRRLYGALSWVIIGLLVLFNYGASLADVPFQTRLIIVPLVDVILVIAWFLVRTLYNIKNSKLKQDKKMELYTEGRPVARYGTPANEEYIPHLTINTDLFESISTKSNKSVILDISMKDYLKPGKVVVFHNEIDYGLLKEVRVLKVRINKDTIETFFTHSND